MSAEVLTFTEAARRKPKGDPYLTVEPAEIIILPVVFVDRGIEQRILARYEAAKDQNGPGQ